MDWIGRRSAWAVFLALGGGAWLGGCEGSEPAPSRSSAAQQALVAGSGAIDQDAGLDADAGLDLDGGDGDGGDTDAGETDAGL